MTPDAHRATADYLHALARLPHQPGAVNTPEQTDAARPTLAWLAAEHAWLAAQPTCR